MAIGIATFVDADDVEISPLPHDTLVACPACEGQGEVYVSGDPRGDNVETRFCFGCRGQGEVLLIDADVTLLWMEAGFDD